MEAHNRKVKMDLTHILPKDSWLSDIFQKLIVPKDIILNPTPGNALTKLLASAFIHKGIVLIALYHLTLSLKSPQVLQCPLDQPSRQLGFRISSSIQSLLLLSSE